MTYYLDRLKTNQKQIPKYINDVLGEAIKREEELQEWRKVSQCNNLHNFKKKKEYDDIKMQQWQMISKCKTPEGLQKKMNKYIRNEEQINNWMNALGVKTIQGLNSKIMKFCDVNIQDYTENPHSKVYNLYIEWINDENLFDYERTYMFLFSMFQKEKDRLIEALYEGVEDLSPFNTWNIAEFLIFMYEAGYDDPDIIFSQLTDEQINKLKNAKNESFDPYDTNNIWYNKQKPETKKQLDKAKEMYNL